MKKCNVCENNKHSCSCPEIKCENHGKCCECVAHHRKLGQMPQCYSEG